MKGCAVGHKIYIFGGELSQNPQNRISNSIQVYYEDFRLLNARKEVTYCMFWTPNH